MPRAPPNDRAAADDGAGLDRDALFDPRGRIDARRARDGRHGGVHDVRIEQRQRPREAVIGLLGQQAAVAVRDTAPAWRAIEAGAGAVVCNCGRYLRLSRKLTCDGPASDKRPHVVDQAERHRRPAASSAPAASATSDERKRTGALEKSGMLHHSVVSGMATPGWIDGKIADPTMTRDL